MDRDVLAGGGRDFGISVSHVGTRGLRRRERQRQQLHDLLRRRRSTCSTTPGTTSRSQRRRFDGRLRDVRRRRSAEATATGPVRRRLATGRWLPGSHRPVLRDRRREARHRPAVPVVRRQGRRAAAARRPSGTRRHRSPARRARSTLDGSTAALYHLDGDRRAVCAAVMPRRRLGQARTPTCRGDGHAARPRRRHALPGRSHRPRRRHHDDHDDGPDDHDVDHDDHDNHDDHDDHDAAADNDHRPPRRCRPRPRPRRRPPRRATTTTTTATTTTIAPTTTTIAATTTTAPTTHDAAAHHDDRSHHHDRRHHDHDAADDDHDRGASPAASRRQVQPHHAGAAVRHQAQPRRRPADRPGPGGRRRWRTGQCHLGDAQPHGGRAVGAGLPDRLSVRAAPSERQQREPQHQPDPRQPHDGGRRGRRSGVHLHARPDRHRGRRDRMVGARGRRVPTHRTGPVPRHPPGPGGHQPDAARSRWPA